MAEYWGAKPKGNTVPETQQEGAGGGGGGGNPLTRKIGPLPMWAWLAIFTAVIVVYAYIKKKSSGTTTGAGTSTGATSVNSPGGVDSSLVPQFVNQTYTSTTPPAAANVTITDSGNTTTTGSTAKPAAQTVSGAPGSYSLDVGGSGNNEWTSTGKYSLNTIAKSHGMTPAQLIAVSESSENNPNLKAYVAKKNYNAMLPAGVQLFIPAANWKTT
jgi:hypothetical protein